MKLRLFAGAGGTLVTARGGTTQAVLGGHRRVKMSTRRIAQLETKVGNKPARLPTLGNIRRLARALGVRRQALVR